MIASILQLIGGIVIGIGFGLLAPWLGVVVWGLLLLVAGVVLELEARNGTRQSVPADST